MLYSGCLRIRHQLLPHAHVQAGAQWHRRVSFPHAQSHCVKILKLHLSLTLSLTRGPSSAAAVYISIYIFAINAEEIVNPGASLQSSPCPALLFVSLQALTLRSIYPKFKEVQHPVSFLPQKMLDFETGIFGEEQICSSNCWIIKPTFYKQERKLS